MTVGEGRQNLRTAFSITQAVPDDLAQITACAARAYQRYIKPMGKRPAPMDADFAAHIRAGEICVARRDRDRSVVIGYVVFYPQCDAMQLENVAVDPDCQGSGIGRALIETVERTARQNRLPCVCLYTNEKMTENLRLYPSLGYRETERRTEQGFNRVYFRKDL